MITLDEAKRRVREVVAGREEYVYDGPCYYFDNGVPSCLVGQAFADELRAVEDNTIRNGMSIDILNERLGLVFEHEAAQWLAEVQFAQDRKVPWGEAVQGADNPVGFRELAEL